MKNIEEVIEFVEIRIKHAQKEINECKECGYVEGALYHMYAKSELEKLLDFINGEPSCTGYVDES